eukprot:UN08000
MFPPDVRVAIIQGLHRIAQGANIIDVTAHCFDPILDSERSPDEMAYSQNDVIWYLRQCIDYWENLKLFEPVTFDAVTDSKQRSREQQRRKMQRMRERIVQHREKAQRDVQRQKEGKDE